MQNRTSSLAGSRWPELLRAGRYRDQCLLCRRAAISTLALEGQLFEAAHSQSLLPKAWLDQKGRLLRANPALCHLLGWNEPDLLQRSFEQLTGASNPIQDWTAFLQGSVSDELPHTSEFSLTHRDGHQIVGLITVSTLRNVGGEAVCNVLHIQDVTARSQIEKELRVSEVRFRAIAQARRWGFSSPIRLASASSQTTSIFGSRDSPSMTCAAKAGCAHSPGGSRPNRQSLDSFRPYGG